MDRALFISVACVAGGIALFTQTPRTAPPEYGRFFGTSVELSGTVIGHPDVRETSQRTVIEVEEENIRLRVLAVAPLHPALTPGIRVNVRGTLSRPEPFDTDGGRLFRYDAFLAKDGVYAIMPFAHVEITGEPVLNLDNLLYRLKHRFIEGLIAALPEPHAGLAAGILAGGKQGLGKELLDVFVVSGLVHIVVLSGYNVMIVAEAIMRLFGFLRRRAAATLAIFTIGLFVLTAGAGAASVRAGIMAGLALFARATGRTYDALRALAVVFVIMLLGNPYLLLHDPGFQLSFSATLGLILGAPVIEARCHWIRSPFFRELTASTVAAQLFVLPLLLHQSGELSLVALPANLLALPVVPLAMLCSAIAGGVGMVAPTVAPIAGVPAIVLLGYLIEVAERTAALPFSSVLVPAFSFYVVPIMYAMLAITLLYIRTMPATNAGMHRLPVQYD